MYQYQACCELYIRAGVCVELAEALARCGRPLLARLLEGVAVELPGFPFALIPYEPRDDNDKKILLDLIEGKEE